MLGGAAWQPDPAFRSGRLLGRPGRPRRALVAGGLTLGRGCGRPQPARLCFAPPRPSLGISRSEVLRRGIRAVGGSGAAEYAGPLRQLVREGLVTPPRVGPGDPPPSLPVAPLTELLGDLDRDRGDR
jgi:hypothetical protein